LFNDPSSKKLKDKLLAEYEKQAKEIGFHLPAYADELQPENPAREAKPATAPNKVVLDYQFDAIERGSVTDRSENKLNGKLNGVVSEIVDGKKVAKFDGKSVIEVPRQQDAQPGIKCIHF
jgi:hypothetical protein